MVVAGIQYHVILKWRMHDARCWTSVLNYFLFGIIDNDTENYRYLFCLIDLFCDILFWKICFGWTWHAWCTYFRIISFNWFVKCLQNNMEVGRVEKVMNVFMKTQEFNFLVHILNQQRKILIFYQMTLTYDTFELWKIKKMYLTNITNLHFLENL